ncbi:MULTISPECIES: energy-coupling factor transporter transmembrane component T [unclassified Bacillus (in: firmicutes)]|uniref:energy-coupling factor transporter transmembrane component T n=1 Tax=unclassified Bacillus (in: firmicutes) TaxID=185979 RepID=UPI0008E62433|nr:MULTISPECIES: energy-coupling factor transporter transmembrane component T [unclassified Bacillus (in: firmicutes)]SFB13508.1 energy-coupling factor transport system permease protein [Bacillus sp. UNCCL13]SFQ89999.1 energy-coupling factor transport system permease protein [Bacillus sp. cl95]
MENRFERLHPIVNFIYYAGALTLLILLLHPIFSGAAFVVILFIHFVQDRFKGLKQWLIFMVMSGSLIFLFNPLFNERGRHVLFVVSEHHITLEAVVYGGMTALSIMGVIALFVSYNLVMTPNKLLFLFSKLLPQFAVLLMLTLRFIPLMRRRLEEITVVQSSKGLSLAQGTWRSKARIGMQYIQVLLTFSLEEAIQTADSMKARGYGQKKRTSYDFFILNKIDIASMFFLILLLVIVFYGRFIGHGQLVIYPLMEKISLQGNEIVFLITYMMFLSFPLLIEIGGKVRWKLFN